jgi:hypothetical protein
VIFCCWGREFEVVWERWELFGWGSRRSEGDGLRELDEEDGVYGSEKRAGQAWDRVVEDGFV